MKNFFKKLTRNIRNAVNTAVQFFDRGVKKINELLIRSNIAVSNARAEGYVDSGVKILIAVVIGALLLAGLYTLFNSTIMPTVTEKVKALFNYKGK